MGHHAASAMTKRRKKTLKRAYKDAQKVVDIVARRMFDDLFEKMRPQIEAEWKKLVR
jgi:hypothetical protein